MLQPGDHGPLPASSLPQILNLLLSCFGRCALFRPCDYIAKLLCHHHLCYTVVWHTVITCQLQITSSVSGVATPSPPRARAHVGTCHTPQATRKMPLDTCYCHCQQRTVCTGSSSRLQRTACPCWPTCLTKHVHLGCHTASPGQALLPLAFSRHWREPRSRQPCHPPWPTPGEHRGGHTSCNINEAHEVQIVHTPQQQCTAVHLLATNRPLKNRQPSRQQTGHPHRQETAWACLLVPCNRSQVNCHGWALKKIG